MRKPHFLTIGMMALVLAGAAACSDDDNDWPVDDNAAPRIELTSPVIQSQPGYTFHITGTISDADGISTIALVCRPMYLDKTIDIIDIYGEPLKTYELDYQFTTEQTEVADKFVIVITVTDVAGNTATAEVTVDTDGDTDAPSFSVLPPDNITVVLAGTATLEYSFTATDNRALGRISASIPEINYLKEVTEFENPTEYVFSDSYALPAENAVYTMLISVADAVGNEVSSECTVRVSDTPDFERMWLADVATAAELNSDVMGVPMLIDHTAEFCYEARYYNQKAGTEIFFLPQRTDFTPICIGLDPADETHLVSDPAVAKPLVLETAGVYYHISFNILTGEYTTETYTPAEAVDPLPAAFGSNGLDIFENGTEYAEFIIGYMTDSPSQVMPFTQDPVNPHLFTLESDLELQAGRHSGFIIHNYHPQNWWNYCTWRADNEQDPETFDYYGNFVNPEWNGTRGQDYWFKPLIPATGKYRLIFDAHLGRGKIIPVS